MQQKTEPRSFDDAWRDIEGSLNENPPHDIAVLSLSARDWYQSDSPVRSSVMDACWDRMLQIMVSVRSDDGTDMPEDESPLSGLEFLQGGYERMADVVERLESCSREGNITGIREQTTHVIEQIEEMTRSGLMRDNDRFVYRSFSSQVEALVWKMHSMDERQIIQCPFLFDAVYFAHAVTVRDRGELEEALRDLHKALHWNPASAKLWFELGETYRLLGQMDEFGQCVYSAYPYIFDSAGMARYHRACADLLIDGGNLREAAAHLMTSIRFDVRGAAKSWVKLGDILEQYGKNFMRMDEQEAAEILAKGGEACDPDQKTVSGIIGLLNQSLMAADYDTALQSATILFELTSDPKMGELIAAINGMAVARGGLDASEN